MQIQKIRLKKYLFLIGLIAIWMLMPGETFAEDAIESGERVMLTIQYPCKETEFELYQIAEISEDGKYIKTDAFQKYEVLLEQVDEIGWRELALTLDGYIGRDDVKPIQAGKINEQNQFTFRNLKPGLYLIGETTCISEENQYISEPALLVLPELGKDGKQITDVVAILKYSKYPYPLEKGTVQRKVEKIWKDGENKNRPKKIEVQLLGDGKVKDTVVLQEKNGWRYQWEELDPLVKWQVVEKEVPKGYTVTINQDDSTFIITNTMAHTKGSIRTLPQTGQLWWPVGCLIVGGIMMFLLGLLRRKNGYEKN